MIQTIVEGLKGFPPELVTVVVSALPISEVRGGIPAGVALGLSLPKAFWWACLGNLLPIAPLLIGYNSIQAGLSRFPRWKRFFDWFFARTEAKADLVRRYEAVGLALFVAVPLPMTGAWTGCAAAFLFKLPFRLAFPAIAAGVLGAGLIVSAALYLGLQIF